jgi:hypothetical protein
LDSSNPLDAIVGSIDKHSGQCDVAHIHSQKSAEFAHNLDTYGRIFLSACGGGGGAGASGGNGEGGGHGADGVDATSYSAGTDGKSGGDGGNAGYGTSGANGGRGGDIIVVIKEEDVDLLVAMAPPAQVGGKAGVAGRNGFPGAGGTGGRGGKSYTWYNCTWSWFTHYRTEPHSYRDSEGRWQTSYTTHTNPGGRNGFHGNPGNQAQVNPVNGRTGLSGALRIFAQQQNGQLNGPYSSSYQLTINDFDIVDGNEDGILEFGEEVTLQNFLLGNTGSTPEFAH